MSTASFHIRRSKLAAVDVSGDVGRAAHTGTGSAVWPNQSHLLNEAKFAAFVLEQRLLRN